MINMEQLKKIRQQLDQTGRIGEVLNEEGKIRPSSAAMELVERESSDKPEWEKYSLAQCLTLLELADKYRDELNRTG